MLTHSERDFQVFSTPDVHACVIRADLLEIISVNGEQAACHGGSPGRETEVPLNSLMAVFLKVTQYLQIPSQRFIFHRSQPVFFEVFLFFFPLCFSAQFSVGCVTVQRPLPLTEWFPPLYIRPVSLTASFCFHLTSKFTYQSRMLCIQMDKHR